MSCEQGFPWTNAEQAFQGDFRQGKELLGFDPYRLPDATGGNRGYYFAYPRLVVRNEEKRHVDLHILKWYKELGNMHHEIDRCIFELDWEDPDNY